MISNVVNLSLAEGIVTEDISEGGKAYKTSEVGDWLAAKILVCPRIQKNGSKITSVMD
jgi:3-isopropylmalate dehydrogenase